MKISDVKQYIMQHNLSDEFCVLPYFYPIKDAAVLIRDTAGYSVYECGADGSVHYYCRCVSEETAAANLAYLCGMIDYLTLRALTCTAAAAV